MADRSEVERVASNALVFPGRPSPGGLFLCASPAQTLHSTPSRMSHAPAVTAFIARWSHAQSAERANYALFLTELCDILDVPHPDPASSDTENNAYVFERAVPLHQRDGKTTTGRIDLYKRGCFVLEAKQYASSNPEAQELALALGDTGPAARKAKIARGTEAWDEP